MKVIKVINGSNLNMLGFRDETLYGDLILEQINLKIEQKYPEIRFDFFQSNHEGEIIDALQKVHISHYKLKEFRDQEIVGVIINPGGYTHTSVSIRDALEVMTCVKVEVHLSDLTKREAFRQVNYIKDVVDASFMGKQIESYFEAIDYILANPK